jgi:hypothetical protein
MSDGESVLAHCGGLRSVNGFRAGGRRCCPAALDRRSGILDAVRTEAAEPGGSKPTGENDRSAQRRQYNKPPACR